jgi:hypothetical protein
MTHWMRKAGIAVLPLVSLFGALPAFAADPPTHATLRTTHVKAVAVNPKTAPVKPSAGSQVMLNPQPIPPGKSPTAPVNASGGSKVMLNPQPIPPGKSPTTTGGDKAIIFVGGKSSKPKAAPKTAPKTAG